MSRQRDINARVWARAGRSMIREYAVRPLRPPEAVVLEGHRDALGGSVLEVGVGAGGLTAHLAELAGTLVGIDLAPAMVAHCRERFPGNTFIVGDLCDLSQFADGRFDALVAGFNVLDVVDRHERREALRGWRRVLAPGGTLVFSTHNLAVADAIPAPGQVRALGVGSMLHSVLNRGQQRRNRARLAPLEQHGAGWAILNDEAHDWSLLHFYAGRDYEEWELADSGFALIECLDLDGRTVAIGETASACPELHYVARRIG